MGAELPREAFRNWLATTVDAARTRAAYWTDLSRLEKLYGDLDAAYNLDALESIRATLEYSAEDKRHGRPNPSRVEIDGDLYTNLSTFRNEINVYKRFRQAEANPARPRIDIRREILEQLKTIFLGRYPDFAPLGFGATQGGYWNDEREYKETVMSRARELLGTSNKPAEARGREFLALLERRPANFVGWRSFSQIKAAGEQATKEIETIFGEMIVDLGDVAELVGSCARRMHPFVKLGTSGSSASSQIRTLLSASLALVRPNEAITVKTRVMQRAARLLIGRPIFREEVITAAEYRDMLALAESIFGVMRDEWQWAPRDLWDVQGFLWVTDEDYKQKAEADEDDDAMPLEDAAPARRPTNLILYGPPGTGKTYATAARAVEICDGKSPSSGREQVMQRYRDLVDGKRISFVTFHQSYAYEDFVEGLRPSTGNDEDEPEASSGGFSLRPQLGVFRQIAARAKENRGRAATIPFDRNRRVFKMSLGRSGGEEGARVFEDAIKGGFVVLGWGGEIDWSDERYSQFSNIRLRWQKDHKDATGADPNIKQVYTLRANMAVHDLVVVSDGNARFRAIGEITGPYQFVPDYMGTYNHRRPVRWLWHSDESQPREIIYGKEFIQVSAYQLRSSMIDWSAIEQIVAGGGEGGQTVGEPEAFVLIIDEINRANVSKVFGELISLIEPDKRLGGENALTVTLPYSRETFGVPSNLHIIGTMNTADRSIALLDTALRRRFEFEELMPDPAALAAASAATGVDLVSVLSGLNARIEYLFDRDHQIGHAFFMACARREDLTRVMRTRVIPLLAEYFYENWEKLRQVLGETSNDGMFIRRIRLRPPTGVDGFESDQERWRYEILSDYPQNAYEQLKA